MSWSDGQYHVTDASYEVEVEEREEQLYESDGKTPVTKTQEDGPAEGKKTRVKLKRYYFRLVLKVECSRLYAGQFDTPPSGFGNSAGKLTASPGFNIPGDSNLKYLCTGERAQCTDTVNGVWKVSQTWTAYDKWERVPKSWDLDQKTELDDSDGSDDSNSGN